MIRLGVVGLGVISRFYLAAIDRLAGFALAAVCDPRPEARVGHAVPAFSGHRAMLAAGLVDAVVVTAPNDAHAAICRDAIEAGLPVCVEKPLDIDLTRGRELAATARARDVALFTAFHRRYNDNVLALLAEVDGRPLESVTVRYFERIEEHVGTDRWYLDAARSGGGCVADNGPNALDVARLFAGPLRLCEARVGRDAAGIDRHAVLTARGTAPVRVELDWSYPGEVKDVTARLADGRELRADMLAGHDGFKGSLWHEYEGVLRDFARAVAAGGASADGGLAALALVDEAYRRENT
ncbi:Gfo/Idh/MocA family oxidoreductase [Amycolatopsis sp. DG1A-15b]|uniref:Gfo/Idh/MocA family protein n=1 Tax=Amycolatopsis sp. DG1A-15b TaxID=3052846 RepID=UPI00255BD6A9|nr:Gfo/Idh/MocA family oxidoreductase [Amycolatopsis sp. DG1A-15b]WIX92307.1 Gfo/Idh/MocA family oxidoreductase [Amycolatopsis sp. DG1A-15b]